MSGIDLTKVGFVGNFQGVTCANNLIVIDSKDFNIKIKNVEREITHFAISKKWLEELTKEEFDKFYGIFSNLLNAKNTAQSFEQRPKLNTVDVDDGDIWFVINDDGSTPNTKLLPPQVIMYTQSAKISDKQQGLTKIKKHCPQWQNVDLARQEQESKERQAEADREQQEKVSIQNQFEEEGFKSLDEQQQKKVVTCLAEAIANITFLRNTSTLDSILENLKSVDSELTTWTEWVTNPQNQTPISTVLQDLPKNKRSCFSYNISMIVQGQSLQLTGGVFGNSFTMRDQILKDMYNEFRNSTEGKQLKLLELESFITPEHTAPVHQDRQIKVDANNVHHKFRRWKNKTPVNKKDVHHRFRKSLNKKEET